MNLSYRRIALGFDVSNIPETSPVFPKSLPTRWSQVGEPDIAFGSVICADARALLEATVQSFRDNRRKPEGNRIATILVTAPDGFQPDIDGDFERILNEFWGKPENKKQTLYLRGNITETSPHVPTRWESSKANATLLSVMGLFTTVLLVTNFCRGPVKSAFKIESEQLFGSSTFIFFMYFFLEVLSLSALLAKQLHLANPKPSVPITPEKSLVRPTFYASALQIVGGYDPTQDGANRFVQNPSLLAEANNGVLSVYDRLLSPDGREALMNAATDSRGNLALGGGDFEIPLCLIIKINRSLNDPTQDKILSNSGRARHIYVPSFHPVTTENINHLLCLVIKTIESAGKNIHARLHSLDYWHDSTIQAIVESLCLENLGIHDVHITASNNRSVAFQSKNWFVWSPKIREIIADLAVRAKRRDAVMHEKEFKSYFFSRVTQEVQNEIDDEFLAHLKQISIYKLPFSKMRSRTRSMPIQLTDESRISISPAPFPNGGPFIDLLDARDALLAGDWAKAMETGIYEGKPLFDLIPLMDGPVVRQCLEKSPFALIAGRDHLIQLLISMVENRLAENRSTGIYRPLCLLVTDRPDLGKDESGADLPAYSSGKSSIINAVRELIERSRAARGYRQPAQLMVPKDTGIQYVTTNALSDYIPKTWLGRIAQFTRRQAPVLALKCIESGALLYTLEQITESVISTYSDPWTRYAALVFPYTLTAVSIGIGAISVAGNDWLDHRFRNPEPAVLNPGTECPRIEIAAQTKDADLLGISRIDLTTPQTQFSKTHPKISALQATSGGIILGENVHEWPDPLRAQIYKMVTEQNAWLGKKFKIPFNVAFLGITGNDTGTRLQNEAHSHGAVYAKISPLLHYPADKPQIQKQLRQYMLIYARQKMQLFWDFRALNWLIDRFILKDKQKIYFGMRYINRLIENAEIRANIRLSAERSSDITQATEDKTLRRDGVNLEDLDAAWQDFIMETPALRIFKGNKQD